jgi:hypothetical protein
VGLSREIWMSPSMDQVDAKTYKKRADHSEDIGSEEKRA